MRLMPLFVAFAVACPLLAGTAEAAATYPVRDRVLTANPLYRTGNLPPSRCPERAVTPRDVAAAKRYLTAVLGCLNRSWAAHFRRAGLPFVAARVGFITKPRKYCGVSWGEAAATYCAPERRFVVLLDDDLLQDTSDLFLYRLAAHEFGHHVQQLAGIEDAYDRHPYRNKSEMYEQSRRLELQAECLSGVFMGSVWHSLRERADADWRILLQIMRNSGDEHSRTRDHGKGRTIAAWLDKGFRAASPQACNTWTSSSAKVS
ncbi:MAG TPA: neutral zinc metallopeptidase [Nonomuraea sp.]|nr:neutral zinc metallopeptidase [Nonomuraea sp.]